MISEQNRLLFVSYWIAPRKAVGTIRSGHILRHLPAFGWAVDTVTAHFGGENEVHVDANCTQTGYYDVKGAIKRIAGIGNRSTSAALNLGDAHYGGRAGIARRAFRFAADLATYPDDYVGWLPFATRAVRKLLAGGKYQALLTSSPPVTTNVIAALSHGNVPWIADLRDLWAEDDSNERSFMRAFLDERLERATLAHAAVLTASSEGSARRFRERYPGKPCYAISTGYEPNEWQAIPFGTEAACTLLYAGNFYGGRRDPSLLFSALRDLYEEGRAARSDVRVDFYCDREPWLMRTIAQYGLDDVVRVLGSMDRKAVLAAERRADRLLVLLWDGPTAEGVVPGKLFEYFGARRPILAVGGTPVCTVKDLLDQTHTGVCARTVEEVKAEVLNALAEHHHTRIIAEDAVSAYTSEGCALAFSRVLDSVVHRHAAV